MHSPSRAVLLLPYETDDEIRCGHRKERPPQPQKAREDIVKIYSEKNAERDEAGFHDADLPPEERVRTDEFHRTVV